MKNLLGIILCFLSFPLFAQLEEKVVRIQDFNEDGIADTLRYELFRGYTHFMTFTDGKSHQGYKFYREDSKASFLGFIAVPEEFLDDKYQVLLDSLKYRLCRLELANQFSPSLKWLMDAYASKIEQPKSSYFSHTIQVPLNWKPWPPELPQASYSFLDSDSLAYPIMYDPDKRSYLPKHNAGKGYLLYYGHNQVRSFYLDKSPSKFPHKIDSTKAWDIYAFSHGLILRKDTRYSWIFHTDNELTGGPGKLRWPSIDTAFIHKGHLFVHHISPVTQGNRVFIINLKNGMIGRLRLEENFMENSSRCFSISIKQNTLSILSEISENCQRYDEGPEKITFPLNELFSDLKNLYEKD